jgi:broad specificity polyphosphatase/5'/3'-nucleotidase SurE
VRDGYISVTPLHPDLTSYAALAHLQLLPLGQAVEVE